MTGIHPLKDIVEQQLVDYLESKESPEEWYVLHGRKVGEYSVWADEELPDDYDEIQRGMPPEDRDANPNVEGFMQVGNTGWSSKAFDFGDDADGFVSEYQWGDKIESNLLGLLVVHESVLSDEALEFVKEEQEAEA